MAGKPTADLPIQTLSRPLADGGGDVFHYHLLEDGSILFVLADVAGHSVATSYAVAAYLALSASYLERCASLKVGGSARRGANCFLCGSSCQPFTTLAARLNRGIEMGPFSAYPVCAMFGLWHPGTGRLHLLNAGMPHPLLYVRETGSVLSLAINGAPLGILDEPLCDETILDLKEGDRLLLASDGLLEAASPERVPFLALAPALWRDLAVCGAQEALDHIVEHGQAHGGGEFADDLLAVVLEQRAIRPAMLPVAGET